MQSIELKKRSSNNKEQSRGLDANKVKLIALLSMTIDHIAVYGFEKEFIWNYYSIIRCIGRIAAPLFLLMLIESINHCQNLFYISYSKKNAKGVILPLYLRELSMLLQTITMAELMAYICLEIYYFLIFMSLY